jgi:hypothetical protein
MTLHEVQTLQILHISCHGPSTLAHRRNCLYFALRSIAKMATGHALNLAAIDLFCHICVLLYPLPYESCCSASFRVVHTKARNQSLST